MSNKEKIIFNGGELYNDTLDIFNTKYRICPPKKYFIRRDNFGTCKK